MDRQAFWAELNKNGLVETDVRGDGSLRTMVYAHAEVIERALDMAEEQPGGMDGGR